MKREAWDASASWAFGKFQVISYVVIHNLNHHDERPPSHNHHTPSSSPTVSHTNMTNRGIRHVRLMLRYVFFGLYYCLLRMDYAYEWRRQGRRRREMGRGSKRDASRALGIFFLSLTFAFLLLNGYLQVEPGYDDDSNSHHHYYHTPMTRITTKTRSKRR